MLSCKTAIKLALCVLVLYTLKKKNLAICCKIWSLLIVLSCIVFIALSVFGANANLPLTNDRMMGMLEFSHFCGAGLLRWAVFVLDRMSATHQSGGSTCLTLPSSPFSSSFYLHDSLKAFLSYPLLFPNPFILHRHCLLPAVCKLFMFLIQS